jgi:purine catabolism regulator
VSAHVLPTVAAVLDLPELRHGRPTVVAGADGLNRPVRWVHVAELPDIAALLQGGELILTTGVALPRTGPALARFVEGLAEAGAAGVVVELGRRFDRLPARMVEAADRRSLPLVALAREVRFVAVTERVHAAIVNAQFEELQASERSHRAFTRLSVDGAEPGEVVAELRRTTGGAVLLQGIGGRVLAFDAGSLDPAALLTAWDERAVDVRRAPRTQVLDGDPTWLVTMVGARGEDWGRLVLRLDGAVRPGHVAALEQAASALALNRLVERDRETLERQAQRILIMGILDRSYASDSEVEIRARSLGVPLDGRQLVGVVLRLADAPRHDSVEGQTQSRNDAEQAARAARAAGLRALVGALDPTAVAIVLSLARSEPVDRALGALAEQVETAFGRDRRTVLAAGAAVRHVGELRRSFQEAEQVAEAALHAGLGRPYYRLADMRIRGLLHLLGQDARVRTYVERELGPLLDADRGRELLDAVSAWLRSGGNKSSAAAACGISRPALYDRLHRAQRLLGVDLDDPETRLSLHVALLAHEVGSDDAAVG